MTEAITRLALPRLTIDVDGTVVRTGATVGWAFRGFNPHHRKDPSYYPLLAHLAQTGHILRLRNRPGNVHDSTQAVGFLRELITDLRARLGRRLVLEFRMDAAFFQRDVFRLLAGRGCGYAIKVGYWNWLPSSGWRPRRALGAGRAGRHRLRDDAGRPSMEPPAPGDALSPSRPAPEPPQLPARSLHPDDGHFEYHAVATNLSLSLPALFAFIAGRGAQEKTIAELKGEFALDVVPTRDYTANSAWQQLSILAHNVARSFQLDTSRSPSRARGSAPTPTCSAACGRSASCSSSGPAA